MLRLGNWNFEGPYTTSRLADRPGVYAVLDVHNNGASYTCIDVGESDEVATRVGNHRRTGCWKRHTRGQRAFAVLYTDGCNDDYRRLVEQDVRRSVSPPCGVY